MLNPVVLLWKLDDVYTGQSQAGDHRHSCETSRRVATNIRRRQGCCSSAVDCKLISSRQARCLCTAGTCKPFRVRKCQVACSQLSRPPEERKRKNVTTLENDARFQDLLKQTKENRVGGIDDGKLAEDQVREVKKFLSNLPSTIELKDLINIKVFSRLSGHWQQQLIHLLPKLDQQITPAGTAELNFSALNNEFFSHAVFQWQERLFEDSNLRLLFLEKLKNTREVAEVTKRTSSAASTEAKCTAHVSERLGSNYAKNLPSRPAEQMVPVGLYEQMCFQHGHKSKTGSQIPSEKISTLAADKTANMIMDDFGVEVLNNLRYISGISGSDLKTYKCPLNAPNKVVSCSANSEKALAPCESAASTQRHSGGEAQIEVIRFGDCSEPCEATDATSLLHPLWKALMMPVEVKLTPLNLETSVRTSVSNGSDGKANCQVGASSDKSLEKRQRSWCNGSLFPDRGHLACKNFAISGFGDTKLLRGACVQYKLVPVVQHLKCRPSLRVGNAGNNVIQQPRAFLPLNSIPKQPLLHESDTMNCSRDVQRPRRKLQNRQYCHSVARRQSQRLKKQRNRDAAFKRRHLLKRRITSLMKCKGKPVKLLVHSRELTYLKASQRNHEDLRRSRASSKKSTRVPQPP
uniref:uncharacterized protein n=1 Tax=Myxine glutinosa TaxID=7769 RepID=UPI00358EE366